MSEMVQPKAFLCSRKILTNFSSSTSLKELLIITGKVESWPKKVYLKFDGSGWSSSLGGSSGGDVGWHDFKSSTFGYIEEGKSGIASKYLSHSLTSSSLNLTGVEWVRHTSSGNFRKSIAQVSSAMITSWSLIWKQDCVLEGNFIGLNTSKVTSSSPTLKTSFPCWTSIKVLPDARKGRPNIKGVMLNLINHLIGFIPCQIC